MFDNLERATAHAETATDVKALADGIALVKRQFLDTLTMIGVERIKTQGAPFDPAFHEAVQQFETDEHPPGTVIHEVQAGYIQGDKLVTPGDRGRGQKPKRTEASSLVRSVPLRGRSTYIRERSDHFLSRELRARSSDYGMGKIIGIESRHDQLLRLCSGGNERGGSAGSQSHRQWRRRAHHAQRRGFPPVQG